MKIVRTINEIGSFVQRRRQEGFPIILVPTMGALHAGHLELTRSARRLGGCVIVSVFVNKTQFGPGEDYDAYPRTFEADAEKLSRDGLADAVFAPTHAEMYPDGDPLTWVTVERMTDHLCGTSRPGHFRGVATVVTKLFTICRPDIALFGLKDAQQYYVIRKLNSDLNLGVDVRGVETVREEDGLALSSRNQYLTESERKQATLLYQAVSAARTLIDAGERNAREIRDSMASILARADEGTVDYADLVDTADFMPLDVVESGTTVVAAVAMNFGKARLIDNQIITVQGPD